VTHREILEIFDLRRLLEPRAVALAALSLDEAQLAELDRCLSDGRQALQSGNTELMFKSSERFRNGWVMAIPNAALKQVIQRYMTQVQAVRMLTFADRINHPLIVGGNARLYDAFLQRDQVAAADRIMRYIHEGETAYLNAVNAVGAKQKKTRKTA